MDQGTDLENSQEWQLTGVRQLERSNLAAPSVDRILRNKQAGFQRGTAIHPKKHPAAGQ